MSLSGVLKRRCRVDLPDFLTRLPNGEIVVTGHRVGLFSLIDRHQRGLSAEQIHDEFPTLETDAIRGALAFHAEHRAEVENYVSDYRADLDRQEAEFEPSKAQLEVRRVMAQKAANRRSCNAS
jgi:uncharacterized protein (DUF433 family)